MKSRDDTGAQLLFRFVAAANGRRIVAIASHWPFEEWGRFLPNETTADVLLYSLRKALVEHHVLCAGRS